MQEVSSRFQFLSKASTLKKLSPVVTMARLCEQIIIPLVTWRDSQNEVLSDIVKRFDNAQLAIRSSASNEDGWDESNAGAHLSLIGVAPEHKTLSAAIDNVFNSYSNPAPQDEVLVQPVVENVVISGVVLTRDLETGSPYYVVNYDDFSGRTDTVTGGAASKTLLVHRSRPDAIHSTRFHRLISSVIEIEQITDTQELDIEFCITGTEDVYILQVRPLAARHKWTPLSDNVVDQALDDLRQSIDNCMRPQENVVGATTILGEMPDWNPAEMIGTTPRPLALSLYKTLITNSIWAEARAAMGYRHVNEPLMIDLHGHPYIDVRLSLNSFLPAPINQKFAENLVNHQISVLDSHPELHDKIEFEVAITCRDFSFDRSKKQLSQDGFHSTALDEFAEQLAALTSRALAAVNGELDRELKIMQKLTRVEDLKTDAPTNKNIQTMMESCRKFGTLPFSKLARHGFISVLFLNSLVKRGALSPDDRDKFMHGINTVASDLVNDLSTLTNDSLSKDEFLKKYGHLRPGTYDISSFRYDEKPDLYIGQTSRTHPPIFEPFEPTPAQLAQIDALLTESGYRISSIELLKYIKKGIQARELAKFTFSRCISDILVLLCQWGESLRLDRDDISFLSIETILANHTENTLRDHIAEAKQRYQLTRAIRLPHLIREADDVDVVRLPLGQPTFITDKSVTASGCILFPHRPAEINGSVVLIESADPGFDWIFLHGIAGLVTKHGGANSHMAIRCAEFGLPAAIGCGDHLFEMLAKSQVIELNCAARKIVGH